MPSNTNSDANLQRLVERIEAATGPDRVIDLIIWYNILGRCKHLNKVRSGAQSDTGFDCPDCGADSWGNTGPTGQKLHDSAPAYTTSIDAAMTLVPTDPYAELRPGQWWWMIEAWPNEKTAHVAYENGDSGIPEFSGKGATPALALCAASLRARINQESGNGRA